MKFTMYLLKRLWRDIIRKACIAAAAVALIFAAAWLMVHHPDVFAYVIIGLMAGVITAGWVAGVWEDFNDDPENQ